MAEISKGQIGCIKTLVRKLNIADADALVLGYSGMRTSHVSELSMAEGIAVTKHLKGLDPDEAAAERMRRKIYAIGYGYHGLGGSASREEKLASRKRTEQWVLQYGSGGKMTDKGRVHKKLDEYNKAELAKLVTTYQVVNVELLQKI